MSPKPKGAVALERRPGLFFTESALADALTRLDGADPEAQMTEAQAGDFVAQFVSPEAVVERRDEFAEFVLSAEAYAAGKLLLAEKYRAQAGKVTLGVERMKAEAVRVMKLAMVHALPGNEHTINLKDSRGAVEIVNADEIPPEFFRVKVDDDLQRIRSLVSIVKRALGMAYGFTADDDHSVKMLASMLDDDADWAEAQGILEASEAARRAVDKTAIQKEWTANGEVRSQVDHESGEVVETPMVPGVRKEVTTKLVIE